MFVYDTHRWHRRGISGRPTVRIWSGSVLFQRCSRLPTPDRIYGIMAMDIQRRKPTATAGKQFPTEFWAWRPIHALVAQLCPDLFDKKTLEAMATGGGGGALDQSMATEMANRFE